ncbi:efflux RND transporter permease subunit [Occallatibacter savannae]|uniref:efflux RND transporter permease subunit n=1 Tax=Occallatibacter savannae TaxID=1002691 RepID=UPI000D68BB4E|nr:efflux RND transporter permease subunit [Occallatibacter savannae]
MPRFAIKYPFFIIMMCLVIVVLGVVSVASMPVDLFPSIDMPVVVVATFYSGMPPEQIEADITDTFERFFTLGNNIEHIESRSLTGVSLIKIYFQPGTDPNAALSNISNLAMADLRRLPPGTLPPVVLGMDASSQPVCLVTLKGKGLNETNLKDLAQFQVRNQIASVQGASVPQPFGGRYRQIMVYVDPQKLEAHNLSLMDVVHGINDSNLILPAGDVRIGPKDYNIYANSQVSSPEALNDVPLKSVGNASVMVGDVGKAEDSGTLQTNIVRIDGQRSVYVPVLKQGGDSNTITIVNGMRAAIKNLVDIPSNLKTAVVFDQSQFVKSALRNLGNEGGIGLVLTALMILLFLGSIRATFAVLLSIPLSALAAFICIKATGGSVNTMVLAGLALAFSRLIDNSVVVLENIFRHLEMGESPEVAAERGGKEVQLAVLAATFTTAIVFFPVAMLYGVSKYLFTALALAVVFSLFASYLVAMTVVPLYCAKFIKANQAEASEGQELEAEGRAVHTAGKRMGFFQRVVRAFNEKFQRMLEKYVVLVNRTILRPVASTVGILSACVLALALYPLLGKAYFPRTDPGQFVINVKCPSGTRLELSNKYIAQVESEIRKVIPQQDLDMIVSNIGITPDLSAIYTSNSSMDTAFVQVSLKEGHRLGSYAYMARVRRRLQRNMPFLSTYFQAGGLVDSVINQGLPAPIDVQVSGNDMEQSYDIATEIAGKIKGLRNVSDVLIPQNLRYPGLELTIDRERASLIGLTPKEVVDNVITAMTSNGMIAPSYWVDPKTGNNYMLTVQYSDQKIGHMTMDDFKQIPLRAPTVSDYTPLRSVADIKEINTPTEVDHYKIRRVVDVYVMPSTEALQKINSQVHDVVDGMKLPGNVKVTVRGSVVSMNQSFSRFAIGLMLSILLVYLILMAQFASFTDPFIILMAIPPGLAGVVVILLITGSTMNIMSLMGVIMMAGIVVSNSILIVEFAGHLHHEGLSLAKAVVESCRIRLRPILMTSLATLLGMIPMALGLEAGSEQYAPLARAIIGGLGVSVVLTVFLVPAVYLIVHGKKEDHAQVEADG